MLLKRAPTLAFGSTASTQARSAWGQPGAGSAARCLATHVCASSGGQRCSGSWTKHLLGPCSSMPVSKAVAAASPAAEARTANASVTSPAPAQEPDAAEADVKKKRGRPTKPKTPKPPKLLLDPNLPPLETGPPVLPAAPRSILRLLEEEPDRFQTITKIKEFKGSIRNQTLMGHLLLLVDRGNITQDKLLSLYGLGTNPGQMHYDQVADALQRCSKVKAKAKRWVEAAQLLTSEHPQHCMAQEREQPGITELQVELVDTLKKRAQTAADAATAAADATVGESSPPDPLPGAPSTRPGPGGGSPAPAPFPVPPGVKPKALKRAQSVAAGKTVGQIVEQEKVKVNTVLQDLIDVTKEGVKVDPDALYTAFRLDGVPGHVQHQDIRRALSALEEQGQQAGSDAMRFYHRVRAHMGEHMGPDVRDRLSAQELGGADQEQSGIDGQLLTIAQIRLIYYLTLQEAQERAQAAVRGGASGQVSSQSHGSRQPPGSQPPPPQRSPSPAPHRQQQGQSPFRQQQQQQPGKGRTSTAAPWEGGGGVHRPGAAGKATRKA